MLRKRCLLINCYLLWVIGTQQTKKNIIELLSFFFCILNFEICIIIKMNQNFLITELSQFYPSLQEEPKQIISQSASELSKFDPLSIPPNFELAELHYKATRISYVNDNDEDVRDPDTLLPANTHLYPLCTETRKLVDAGPGFPLYFDFIKFMIILLCSIFVASIPIIIFYSLGSACQGKSAAKGGEDKCESSFMTIPSLANRFNVFSHGGWLDWYQFVYIIVFIIACQIWRAYQRRSIIKYDEDYLSVSDYTIVVYNLPTVFPPDVDIKQCIQSYFINQYSPEMKRNYIVTQVVPAYDIREYSRLFNLQKDLQRKTINNADCKIEQDITAEELGKLEKEFTSGKSDKFLGIAFVSFLTQQETKELLDLNYVKSKIFQQLVKISLKSTFFKFDIPNVDQKYLYFEPAPEPNDIKWENLYISDFKYLLEIIVSAIITILFLIVSFGFNFGLIYLSVWLKTVANSDTFLTDIIFKILIPGLISFIIVCTNYVISTLIVMLARNNKHASATIENINSGASQTVFLFINSAILTVMTKFVFQLFIGPTGLIPTITYFYIYNSIVNPSLMIFNTWYYYTRIKIWLEKRKGENCLLTQQEFNKLCEETPFFISSKYATNIKAVWMALFFIDMIPMGAIYTAIGIFFQYWTDKYYFLRRTSNAQHIGSKISLEFTSMLEVSILLIPCGSILQNLIFYLAKHDEHKFNEFDFLIYLLPSVIALGVGGLYLLLPRHKINKMIFKVAEEVMGNESYNEAKNQCGYDYDLSNPALSHFARRSEISSIQFFKKNQMKEITFHLAIPQC